MAEEQGQERSQPASARRLEKAREEGRVPRSTELGTFAALLACVMAMGWGGERAVRGLAAMLNAGLRIERRDAFDAALLGSRLVELALQAAGTVAPLAGALLVTALAAPLAVGGWVLSWPATAPQLQRIDPLAGLGRLLSLNALTDLAKAVLKAVLLGVVAGLYLWNHRELFASLAALPLNAALSEAGASAVGTLGMLAAVMAGIATIDVPVQIWRHRSQLRMSLQELREEARESDGDPQLRARIRSQQREVARRRMMSAVPKADVVITNPTHFAVALRYRQDATGAPRVVAKGTGEVAARIRELAREHGVPLLEAPPLARALYRHVDIDAEIPQALYDAVAMVLAWVYQVRRSGAPAQPPASVPVPPEYNVPETDSR